MAIYNNLVIFDQNVPKNSLESIVPDLATSWETKDGGRKLVFRTRDGVKWHDGKPFSAADVACTFDLILTPDRLRRNPRSAWYTNLEKVTADGPSEVTFHLKQPQPSLLALLASGYTPIYPCHVPAADMRRKPVGTGPFKLADFRMNEGIKLVKNPDYWKPGRPYLDAIEFSIIPDRSTRMLSFVAGKFDMTFPADVTVPLLKNVKRDAPPGAVHDARERRQHQPDHQSRGRALRQSEDPPRHGADARPRGLHPDPERRRRQDGRRPAAASRRRLGPARGEAEGSDRLWRR
jgi:peptide/nickel transport system substrate-binding protein